MRVRILRYKLSPNLYQMVLHQPIKTTAIIGHLGREAYLLAGTSCCNFATVFFNQLRTLAWSL
jgi:hypothetical protein